MERHRQIKDAAHEMNPSKSAKSVGVAKDGNGENEDVTRRKRVSGRNTKRCNKIRFQHFQVSTVGSSIFMLDWYLGITIRNSKAKIKSSRDSLRLKFNAHKKRRSGEGRVRWRVSEWMLKQFSTTFFQFITFKGRCCVRREGERDRTVKNPSEAFNLLLQQNFISTLIFLRARGAILHNRNKYFMFFFVVQEISFSPQWKCSFAKEPEKEHNSQRNIA